MVNPKDWVVEPTFESVRGADYFLSYRPTQSPDTLLSLRSTGDSMNTTTANDFKSIVEEKKPNHPPELTAEELRKLVPVLEEKFDSKSFHLQSARAENA
jgi:hypothetical protein